jgi:transcriptional/translational regulatory protein YebC/TACO1
MSSYYIKLHENEFDRINSAVMAIGALFIKNKGTMSSEDVIKFNYVVRSMIRLNGELNERMIRRILSKGVNYE